MLAMMRPINTHDKKRINASDNPRWMRKLLALLVAALVVSSNLVTSTRAAAGTLDLTFDADGKVTTDFGSYDNANAVAIQPDGRIVAAGSIDLGDGSEMGLVRYNPDGSLDQSFGAGGKVVTVLGERGSEAHAIALQPDGRIVAAGVAYTGEEGTDFAVVRYNPNGTLDASFGSGGKVITDTGESDRAQAVVIQSDGRIVAAGATTGTDASDYVVVRYNSNGSLDTTFDADGIATTDFAGHGDEIKGIAPHGDGLVAAGSATLGPATFRFALARYKMDGSLDPAFGTGGKATADFSGSGSGASAVAVVPGGLIIAAGIVVAPDATRINFALARFQANGSLDNSFGTGGKVVTDFSAKDDIATAMALQKDGRILVAGYQVSTVMSNNNARRERMEARDFLLARYNANGSLDTGFGAGGSVVTDFSGRLDEAYAIALQTDGSIVAAGLTRPPDGGSNTNGGGGSGRPDIALARYRGDFDLCVQDNTNGNFLLIDRTTGKYSFTSCRKGFTLTGQGTITINSCKLELRDSGPNPKTPDRSVYVLVNPCTAVATANLQVFSTGQTYTINDSNINDNTCSCSTAASASLKTVSMMEMSAHIRFEFDVCLWDESARRLLQFNSATGRYQFRDCLKGITLSGSAVLVSNGCKTELFDTGPDPKRPDRSVYVLYNSCTNDASGAVQVTLADAVRYINGTGAGFAECNCN